MRYEAKGTRMEERRIYMYGWEDGMKKAKDTNDR